MTTNKQRTEEMLSMKPWLQKHFILKKVYENIFNF